MRGNVEWDVSHIKGLVTAIYVTKGGLKITQNIDAVTGVGVHLTAVPYQPVTFCAGWQNNLSDTARIEVPTDDKHEWIIAIKLHRLELRHVKEQLNPINLADSGTVNPPNGEEESEA